MLRWGNLYKSTSWTLKGYLHVLYMGILCGCKAGVCSSSQWVDRKSFEVSNYIIWKLHPIVFAHWSNWSNSLKGSLILLACPLGAPCHDDGSLQRYPLSVWMFHSMCVLHYYNRELSRCWEVSSWDTTSEQSNDKSHNWRKYSLSLEQDDKNVAHFWPNISLSVRHRITLTCLRGYLLILPFQSVCQLQMSSLSNKNSSLSQDVCFGSSHPFKDGHKTMVFQVVLGILV